MRRAELAVGAFGATAFLLSLVFILDALRFHHHVLLDALRLHSDARGYLLLAVAAIDVLALARAGTVLWSGVAAQRRIAARLPVRAEREVGGRRVAVVPGARPLAFCTGLVRPRIVVSEGALALGPVALAAIVEHEAAHAARRDPLRILIARAVGDAFWLRALSRRERALTDLAADAGAVRALGSGPLAAALLAFGAVAPERVDQLAGAPRHDVPRVLLIGAGLVVLALLAFLTFSKPGFCLPLATAPAWTLAAIGARLAALCPAWLGARRAGSFLS